ncbi:sensor histidine kinase [Aeromicrobium terrae]|uniref:histidine kinase n=1 Tax=Aeromicrobium terrae TaxID=2498846 RepID=A0A5C8NP21_9ACTN|nr:HAMP domain-containing sensor histidine kinase [Aeromicrobium terrae]TXL62936.1 HAMP domain-containing histidine kinase [Aeromicrobium terrae]
MAHTRRSRLTIKRRLVRNVAVAMLLVLVVTSGFVFWRVKYGLDRQVSRDLRAYDDVVTQDVKSSEEVPSLTPGQWYQVVDENGDVVAGSASAPVAHLLTPAMEREARQKGVTHAARGSIWHPDSYAFQLKATRWERPEGQAVIVAAISRRPRDETLRELLLQLALADLAVLIAASYVGYRTARGALDPVERYRAAAAGAGDRPGTRLPVDPERRDELSRLGVTLNDLIERLERANEREHQFLADAAHELRTPLALISGEVELALHQQRDAEYLREVVVAVAAETERMAGLANALLDLEELESGVQASVTSTDLGPVLRATADRYRAVLEREGRVVVVEASHVEADVSEPWIDAALGNLVSNAVRYGAGTVTLSVRAEDDAVLLAVDDEGDGFPDDLHARAFDRFTRADASRTTRGSGLGLPLVMAIAQAHGGTARIERLADPARTRVLLLLPRR